MYRFYISDKVLFLHKNRAKLEQNFVNCVDYARTLLSLTFQHGVGKDI